MVDARGRADEDRYFVDRQEALMKRLVQTWTRRRRAPRMLVFRVDRPRRIDRVIDYFGERLAPVGSTAVPRDT